MRATKDLLSGLLFAAIGLAAMIIARGYHFGTAMDMGPGYFPVLLGGIVALIGLAIVAQALIRPDGSEPVDGWEVRPLICVLAAVLGFGFLIETWGLIASVVVLILVARLVDPEKNMVELAVMTIVLTAIAVGIFVYGLQMPLRLGPV